MLNSSTKKTFPNKGSHFLFASAWRGIWRSIREGKKLHWSWNAHIVQLTLHNKRKGWMAWFKEVGWVGQNTWRPYSFKRQEVWIVTVSERTFKGAAIWKDKGKITSLVFFQKSKIQFSVDLKVVTRFFLPPNRIRFLKTFNEEFFVLLFLRPSLRNAMFLTPQACAMPYCCF